MVESPEGTILTQRCRMKLSLWLCFYFCLHILCLFCVPTMFPQRPYASSLKNLTDGEGVVQGGEALRNYFRLKPQVLCVFPSPGDMCPLTS